MKQTSYEQQKGTFEGDYDYFTNHHRHNFNKVADPTNWKMPTKAVVVHSMEEAQAIQDSVIYFAGSIADIIELSPSDFGVKSATGYYVEIGA